MCVSTKPHKTQSQTEKSQIIKQKTCCKLSTLTQYILVVYVYVYMYTKYTMFTNVYILCIYVENVYIKGGWMAASNKKKQHQLSLDSIDALYDYISQLLRRMRTHNFLLYQLFTPHDTPGKTLSLYI